MDDKVKAAIVGFNVGFGGYLLVRSIPTLFSNRVVIDGSWMFTNILIGLVLGAVLAAIAYVAMLQTQK